MNKQAKVAIVMLVAVILAYYGRDYLGTVEIPLTYIVLVMGFMGFFLYSASIGSWRYATPQIIAPNFHASILFDPYDIPNTDYVAIPFGSYMAVGMSKEGGEGTLITLKSLIKKVSPNLLANIALGQIMEYGYDDYSIQPNNKYVNSSNYLCFCPMMPYRLEWLPPKIIDFIESDKGKFKGPYFFGYALDETKAIDLFGEDELKQYLSSIAVLSKNYADTNALIHTYRDLSEGNFRAVSRFVDTLGGINKALYPTDWKSKFIGDKDRRKIERDDER